MASRVLNLSSACFNIDGHWAGAGIEQVMW